MTTDEGLSILHRGLDQLGALIASVGPDDLDRSTPCEDWTVRDLVAHVVQGPANFAASVRGTKPDWSAGSTLPDDPAAAFAANAADLRAAWDEHPDAPSGPGFQTAEVAVHTYDLATALGRPTAELDPEVAAAGLAMMSASLTPENRGAVFKPEREAPAGADPYQQVAAFAGRKVT